MNENFRFHKLMNENFQPSLWWESDLHRVLLGTTWKCVGPHFHCRKNVRKQTEFLFHLKIKWKYIEGVSSELHCSFLSNIWLHGKQGRIYEILLSKY